MIYPPLDHIKSVLYTHEHSVEYESVAPRFDEDHTHVIQLEEMTIVELPLIRSNTYYRSNGKND